MPSDFSKDPKIAAQKCLAVLGVPGMLQELGRKVDPASLSVIESGIKTRDAFLECIRNIKFTSVRDKQGHAHDVGILLKNTEDSLQLYLTNGSITGKLKKNVELLRDAFDDTGLKLLQREKGVKDKLKHATGKKERLQPMHEIYDMEKAAQYAAVASSQMEAMLDCLRQAWREKVGLATEGAGKTKKTTYLSPTHVSDHERIACEKCLVTLGDTTSRNKLYQYGQSKLFGIVGETEQVRPKLLSAVATEPFNIKTESERAVGIIYTLLEKGTLTHENRQVLAAVRNRYNAIGASLERQAGEDGLTEKDKDIRDYTALVASQIDAVLQFLHKKEKIDPCNRALAALGDEDAMETLENDGAIWLRRFAHTVQDRREIFYEVLEAEKLNVIPLQLPDGASVKFHFRDANLACLSLRGVRDSSEPPRRETRKRLHLTRCAFEAVVDKLCNSYMDSKKRPADVQTAIDFANMMRENIDNVLDYVDRHTALLKEDKGRSLGW